MSDSAHNLEVVRSYLKALQAGEAGDALRRFFTQDVRQIEMPNQLNPRGQERPRPYPATEFAGTKDSQTTTLRNCFGDGSRGSGCGRGSLDWVLAVTMGTLAAGAEMNASFAMFFQFRDGQIAMQRNYDCFDA